MPLEQQHCVPCEGGTPPLTSAQITQYQKQVHDPWDLHENIKISKKFTFKNFKQSMAFVNKIAALAEAEGHHPDIYIFYSIVRLELWTHAIGGLSENDFIMARKIELL